MNKTSSMELNANNLNQIREKKLKTEIVKIDGKDFALKKEIYCIYCLINKHNKKRYVGRTTNPKKRLKAHLYGIRNKSHQNKLIKAENNNDFDFEILEDGLEYRDACEREKTYMVLFKTYLEEYGYNANDRFFIKTNYGFTKTRKELSK